MQNRNSDPAKLIGTVRDITYWQKVEETILLQASTFQSAGTEILFCLPKRK